MLWSLFKLVLFVCAVAAMAFGASLLMETNGGIRLEAVGMEINLGPLQSVIALIVLLVALWLVLKLIGLLRATWLVINGDETALTRFLGRRRLAKGYDALADGMMALASGEGRLAMVKAERAERYLERPELTNLLTAQAAEMAGDRKKAEETYKALITDDRTRFVGVRGILRQRLADGDTDTALVLAKSAFALKPKHEETQDVLLKLQADSEDWSGARETLAAKLKHGALPRDVHKRRDAVLALSEVKAAEEPTASTQDTVMKANKASPELVPAAVLAADVYMEKGQPRQAVKAIKAAWTKAPHPDLAAAFAAIEPDETPQARIKRFEMLRKLHPDADETRMLLAELHIAAEDFPEARRALGDLAETHLTVRVATLMAAIEKGEGAKDPVVKGWLARAVTAPRGPSWVCDNCQHISGEWVSSCPNCGAIDSMTWAEPPEQEFTLPGGADMLPLLVGSDDSDPAEEEIMDAVIVVEDEPQPDVAPDAPPEEAAPEAELAEPKP